MRAQSEKIWGRAIIFDLTHKWNLISLEQLEIYTQGEIALKSLTMVIALCNTFMSD